MVADAVTRGSILSNVVVRRFTSREAADSVHLSVRQDRALVLVFGAMLSGRVGILLEGYRRLIEAAVPTITPVTVGVMFATLVVNLAVSTYEKRKGEEYRSQILVADSMHTRSDVFVSVAVLGGFLAVRLGFPQADPIVAFAIGLLIARMGFGILYDAAQVLTDTMKLPCDPALVGRW
jgi:cation diffusion facilitator family transporter